MKNNISKKVTKYNTVRDYINESIKKYSDNTAFILKSVTNKVVNYTNITYKEFGDTLKYFGTSLINLGLENKRIAIIGKNSYTWAISYISVLNGVGITVPLDKGLPPSEIESSLIRSKADAIIFEEDYLDIMKGLKSKLPNIKEFICMSNVSNEFKNMDDLILSGKKSVENEDNKFDSHEIRAEEMATIIFTSGTTSMSKAVVLSNKNIASNLYSLNCIYDIYPTDRNICFLPFHHTYGSTGFLLMLTNGVTNTFCDGLKYIAQNLKEYKITIFICVPLLLEMMDKKITANIEKQGKTNLIKNVSKVSNTLLKCKIDIRRKLFKQILDNLGGELRLVISGSAPIDKNVGMHFDTYGITSLQGYGLTETSPVLTGENLQAKKAGSIGVPLPDVEIKIDNPDEHGIGELVAKGPNIMLGYYEMPNETAEVLKDGWFYTGDLAYIDKDGYIFITGRKKNVIVLKNGKNIYPEEIETLVATLPYVSENLVYGTPKNESDYTLSVKIVYNKEYMDEKYKDISNDDLYAMIWNDVKELNKNLANYKHIKHLEITDEPMVKTSTQKIKRFEEIKKINE